METLCHLNTADHAEVVYGRRPADYAQGRDPLLLIHGAASNMTRWSQFITETSLAESRDIIRLDLRGHGRSQYRGRIGLEIWCDDIAALLRQEGQQQAILIGHCLGANIAVMFAARYPQLAGGLILIEPILHQALIGKLRRLSRFAVLVKMAIVVIHLANRCGIYRRHLAALDLYQLDKVFKEHLAEPGGQARLARRYGSAWHDLRFMPSANLLADMLEVVRPLPLEKMRVPFMALLSSSHTFVDPKVSAAVLSALPGGEIHTLEAGHWIPTEQSETMRVLIEKWLTD